MCAEAPDLRELPPGHIAGNTKRKRHSRKLGAFVPDLLKCDNFMLWI
ncbi:MAG: hypothetical protein ACI4I1_01265 [Oscillospiraceae bacterium]